MMLIPYVANIVAVAMVFTIILDDKGVGKLTPRECANFQGFPKNYKLPNIADSQLYKQFGNSVVIPVVQRIAENMKKAL